MAITPNDFDKIWSTNASTPAYTFSDADYLEGWDFVGNLPPTRAQWNAIQKRTDEKMKYIFDNFGSPLVANTVADMTLENRVYVYTGSEVGYTAGDWYYYDEGTSAWVDGGVYNAVAIVTDTTLTQAGVPADAKATGDALSLKADTSTVPTIDPTLTVRGDGADAQVTGDSINNGWLGFNGTSIAFNQIVRNTGTATNVWIYNAIDVSYTDFYAILTKTENVTKSSEIVRFQLKYTDTTEENKYVHVVGKPARITANSQKTLSAINISLYRSSSALDSDVASEWGLIAYVGNNISSVEEIINSAKKEVKILEAFNDTSIIVNERYTNVGSAATFWVTESIPARQDPFYVKVTDVQGVDVSATSYLGVRLRYTDSTNSTTYITQLNTPTLVSPTSGKTVSKIDFAFTRASSTVTLRWTAWNVIAFAGNKLAEVGSKVTVLEDKTAIIGRSVGKYQEIFQGLGHKMPTDDGTSMFYSGISWGHDVMKTDEEGIIIEIDPTNIIGRVYIWENAPQSDVRYDYLYNWEQGSWYRAYIAPNTYFSVVFRNPTQTPGLTVETVQNNCRIMAYNEYANAYMQNGIRAFEEKIALGMADYPIMFGVITDCHYPTGDNQYPYKNNRNAIKNGCNTLKEIGSRLNAFFIVNLGDDAGYSNADTNEGNIIQCMTTVDGMLRGGVNVYPVNGNHEAYQNHEYMDSTDFYRARMVNLRDVTKVSNIATNYYFDDDYFKIRFVFFDVETYHRNDYSDAIAGAELASMFSTAPSDYKFILLCHKDIGNDPDFPNATNFYTYISSYLPRLIFQCSGHTHTEGYYNSNGVRDINFMAGGYFNYTGLTQVGQWSISDRESSFAIVGVNPTTMKVKVFGYGMATDRTFDFS